MTQRSFREMLLGKSGGQTAWQKLKESWSSARQSDNWQAAFKKVPNPLGLQIGDLVDLSLTRQFEGKRSCKVESVLFYETPGTDPKFVRYGLRSLASGEMRFLEVLQGQSASYAVFELIDEIPWDDQLVHVVDAEDTMRHTIERDDGRSEVVDYRKDFICEASLFAFAHEAMTEFSVRSANYFRDTDQGEEYLVIEMLEDAERMNFYRGVKISSLDFEAFATAPVVGF